MDRRAFIGTMASLLYGSGSAGRGLPSPHPVTGGRFQLTLRRVNTSSSPAPKP